MNSGFIKLHRKALDSGLIQHAKAWQFLSWCLLSATYKPYKRMFNGVLFDLQPGQLVASRSEICSNLRMTVREFRSVQKLLENADFLTSEGTSAGTVFSIVNWACYQQDAETEGPAEGPAVGQRGANGRSASKYKQEYKNNNTYAQSPDGLRAEAGTLVCDKETAKALEGKPPREDLTGFYLPVKSPEMSAVAFLKAENWKLWESTYGTDFCLTNLRRAYRWCLDQPGRVKTVRGIHKFFGAWLDNEQNKPGPSRASPPGRFPSAARRRLDENMAAMEEFVNAAPG